MDFISTRRKIGELLKKHRRILFFLITVCAGIAIFYPFHNFQLHLAQGDHGRDLYGFKKTLDGALVYRDYWWVYGPLMPYYYALCYKLFGINIHSVLLGYSALNFLSGLAVYFILLLLAAPLMAFTGAVWFWVFCPPFEYTYNHAGGILAILIAVYMIFLYARAPRLRYLYGGLFSIFILSFIKINFGASMLLAFIASAGIIDFINKNRFSRPKLFFYLTSLILAPAIVAGIYYLLIKGLPLYVVRQCFPYLKSDQPFHPTFWGSIQVFFKETTSKIGSHWAHWVMGTILVFCAGYVSFFSNRKTADQRIKLNLPLAVSILLIFSLCNLHEFLMSAVYYRIYWIKPFQILLLFIIISAAVKTLPRWIKYLLCAAILLTVVHEHYHRYRLIREIKVPQQYMDLDRGKIYIGNFPPWLTTVTAATQFLKNTLGPNETFLALVDDPLYYFLTGKDSPTRQLAFCNHLNIELAQEKEIIERMEQDKINYILLSNKAFTGDSYMGTFGKTYCRLLARYVKDNFSVVAGFGLWRGQASWLANHGVLIFKRKQP